MPQEIRVLCCFKCKMYQVDIVKKAKKWQCKMCAEKQSVFNELFRGTGAECRKKAQELNFNTKTKQTEVENEILNLLEADLDIDLGFIANEERKQCDAQLRTAESKWARYVEECKETHSTEVEVEHFRSSSSVKKKSDSNSDKFVNSKCIKASVPSTSKWNAYL